MLSIHPVKSLMDSKIEISVTSLNPGKHITIACKVIEKNYTYVSHGHYVASLSGEVHLKDDASFGGSYTGVSQMGIFWSMGPSETEKKARRYIPTNVTKPAEYHVQVFEGHLGRSEVDLNKVDLVIAEGSALRCCCAPSVTRHEVAHGRVIGTIFKPNGNGRYKGVVDIYGGAGGIVESRAALLASHGFVAFTLPYFSYKDLPKTIHNVEVEYFIEALSYFQSLEYVLPGISMVGLSYGASLSLCLSTLFPGISSVVSINGKHYLNLPVLQNGESYPPILDIPSNNDRPDFLMQDQHGAILADVADYDDTNCEEVTHKLERTSSRTKFLFVIGEDDKSLNSKAAFDVLYRRMQRYGKEEQLQLLSYPGAGHFIDPPFMPQSLFGVYYRWYEIVGASGGKSVENAAACMHSWKEILFFLKNNTGRLNCNL